jgi:hypothetical protein
MGRYFWLETGAMTLITISGAVVVILILAVIVWIGVMSVRDFITFFRNKK